MYQTFNAYMAAFYKADEEYHASQIPNAEAASFLAGQIPLLECPDKQLEEIYYFRWWTFRKHIKQTPQGCIFTEFLSDVRWSGPYNSINCPACFHIREARWLKDPENLVKQYINFWLDGTGDAHRYSAWYAHAVLEYCTIKNDFAYGVEKLPQLVAFFDARAQKQERGQCLYWSNDGYDGMEYSISGSGLRPTLNSYAYGDACAIAKLAAYAGDRTLEARFTKIAQQIKTAVDTFLWDRDFYKTIPLSKEDQFFHRQRPPIPADQNVRELIGLIPWYFNLPDEGKDGAFANLLHSNGFQAPYGLTTAEQQHPRFMEPHKHECLWNGPVWPFATSQVLVATANLLRNYTQSTITKEDYYAMLLQYARSHRMEKPDGTEVPWIDENLDPYTGRWLARDRLESWGWLPEKGGYERGKDYNHSLFCDLILSGLLGIGFENNQVTVRPLIPDEWDYFRVDNLWLGGKCYNILYDKDGSHYNCGKGILIRPTP